MKKTLLTVLALGAMSFSANAQKPDLKLGAKAGLNISSLSSGDSDDNFKSKTGFNVGVLAEIFINEKFSVQPELLYSSQGAKNSYFDGIPVLGTSFKVDQTIKLDYINIPIMAKYYVWQGLSVQAGPQIGFLVKSEVESELRGNKKTVDIKDSMNTVDFSLNIGAGYDLPMGVFVDARYNFGISNVDKKVDGYQEKMKNGVFQLSVGYKF